MARHRLGLTEEHRYPIADETIREMRRFGGWRDLDDPVEPEPVKPSALPGQRNELATTAAAPDRYTKLKCGRMTALHEARTYMLALKAGAAPALATRALDGSGGMEALASQIEFAADAGATGGAACVAVACGNDYITAAERAFQLGSAAPTSQEHAISIPQYSHPRRG